MQFQFRESEVSSLFVLLVVFFVSDEGLCNSITITSSPPSNSKGVLYYCASEGRPCTITCSFDSQTPDPDVVVNGVAYSVTGLRGDSLYHNVSSRDGRLVFTFQLDNSVNNYNYSCVQNGGGTSGLIVLKSDVSQCTSQADVNPTDIRSTSLATMVSTATMESNDVSSSIVVHTPTTSGGQGTGLGAGGTAGVVIGVFVVIAVLVFMIILSILYARKRIKKNAGQPTAHLYDNLPDNSSSVNFATHVSGTEDHRNGDNSDRTAADPDRKDDTNLVSGSHETGVSEGENGRRGEAAHLDVGNGEGVRHKENNNEPSPNVTGETDNDTLIEQNGGSNHTTSNVDRESDRTGSIVQATAGSDSRTGSSTAGNDNVAGNDDHTGSSTAGGNECGSNNDSSVGVSRTQQSSNPTTSGVRSPGDGTDGNSVPFSQPEQGRPGASECVVPTLPARRQT
jgi:hypothetical protein